MPTTLFRAARASLDDYCSRRSHVVMETSDGREGFAMFGGFRARHRFGALYFPTAPRTRTRLVVHRPVTADYCRRLVERYGLVVFCGHSAPRDLASELLPVPFSVDMEMPTPLVFEGPGAPWSRSAKANIARIKKGRFGFDVVTGDEWIAEFQRRMFRPSMRGRHGAQAYLDSRRMLATHARGPGGEMLRVFQDGRWVGGCIGRSTPGGYRLLKLGWLNGDEALLRSGVVSALYWFSFKRAAALGRHRILLGSVTPYLEDGVLLHKSSWGARLSVESRYFSEFRLLLEPSHPACLAFLKAYSMVTLGTNRDFIVFSGRGPDIVNVPRGVLSDIKRWYTWCDQPLAVPEVGSEEVPRPLRPWVTFRGSPGER
jgi:hypothetical protein